MTLPASGQISMSQVNTELGLSATAQISLGDSAVRSLAGVPSGAISLDNLHGKSNQFAFTISSNTANLDLRAAALAAGWGGASKAVCTINSGVYVYSSSTGTPALTISGSFPGGVSLVNNGTIIGRGGNGGAGGPANSSASVVNPGGVGGGGGTALSVSVAASVTNNGIISGGGGGGGGGGSQGLRVGGGGGGGIGNSTGGSGFVAGGNGTLTTAGTGGSGSISGSAYSGNGGSGGSYGSSGGTGTRSYLLGKYTEGGGAGGAGGSCTSGNSNITWVATGTRYGALN